MKKQFQEQEKKLNEFSIEFLKQSDLKEQLGSMQDQIDILQPEASKVSGLETQIDRLRTKIEDLNDIKQKYKDEGVPEEEIKFEKTLF